MSGWLDSVIGLCVALFVAFLVAKPFMPLIKGFWEWLSGIFGRIKGDEVHTTKSNSINYE